MTPLAVLRVDLASAPPDRLQVHVPLDKTGH
jgi:hypothetical protein